MKIREKGIFVLMAVLMAVMVSLGGPACGGDSGKKDTADGSGHKAGDTKEVKVDDIDIEKIDLQSFQYTLEMTVPGAPTTRMEYKKDKKRFSMKLSKKQGGKWTAEMYMMTDGKDSYMVQPGTKMAMKMPPNTADMMGGAPLAMMFVPEWDEYKKSLGEMGLKKTGKEKIHGVKTVVYELASPGTKQAASYYIDKNNMLRRIVINDPESGKTMMDLLELKVNPKFKDSDFMPPAGYKIQDLSKMPGMGSMPKFGQ